MAKKFDLTRYTGKSNEQNKPKTEKKYALYDKITLEDNNKDIETGIEKSPFESSSKSTVKNNDNIVENRDRSEKTESVNYMTPFPNTDKESLKGISERTLKSTEESTVKSLKHKTSSDENAILENNKDNNKRTDKKTVESPRKNNIKNIVEDNQKRKLKDTIRSIEESTTKENIKEDNGFIIASPKKTKIGFDANLHEYLKTEAYKNGLSLSAYMNEILRLTPEKVINNYHDGKFDTATMYYVPRSARGKQGIKSTVIFAGDVYDKMIKGAAARQQNLTQYVNLVVAAAKSINES